MRLRIYSTTPDGARHTFEIDVMGDVVRICDDHGRIVTSQPWPEPEFAGFETLNTTQPLYDA